MSRDLESVMFRSALLAPVSSGSWRYSAEILAFEHPFLFFEPRACMSKASKKMPAPGPKELPVLPLKASESGVRVSILVKPNAKHSTVTSVDENFLSVQVCYIRPLLRTSFENLHRSLLLRGRVRQTKN